jgi:hypothetical protein
MVAEDPPPGRRRCRWVGFGADSGWRHLGSGGGTSARAAAWRPARTQASDMIQSGSGGISVGQKLFKVVRRLLGAREKFRVAV